MMKIGLKLTKQSKVALFRHIFSKTTILPDFTLTHLCYSDLVEDDITGHTGHSSVAWICHDCDGINYSQHATSHPFGG